MEAAVAPASANINSLQVKHKRTESGSSWGLSLSVGRTLSSIGLNHDKGGSSLNLMANKSSILLPKPEPEVASAAAAVDQHPFVKSLFKAGQFCEYCYKETVDNDAQKMPYTCELCSYVAHKNCRNAINIVCVAISKNMEELVNNETISITDKVMFAADRYFALDTESSTSQNIRNGIEKMSQAKTSVSTVR